MPGPADPGPPPDGPATAVRRASGPGEAGRGGDLRRSPPDRGTLAGLGVADLVDGVVCADDGFVVKPAPDMLRHLCATLDVPVGATAMVGDSTADLAMGRAAGVARCVGVLSGVGSRRDVGRSPTSSWARWRSSCRSTDPRHPLHRGWMRLFKCCDTLAVSRPGAQPGTTMLRTRPADGRPAAGGSMPPRSSVRSDRAARRRDRPYGEGPGPAGSGRRVKPGSRARTSIGLGRGRRRGFRAPRVPGAPAPPILPGCHVRLRRSGQLVDPRFLHDTGPGSIGEQLVGFSHVSPLSPLIQLAALQAPVLVGFLIALAEIAIGLAALTGLLYRLAAAGGFALSVMFWLTASWATKPYYYGPDLPYALGWLTIGLAGHGGLYVLDGAWDRWAGRRIVRARYGDYVPPAELDAWSADPGRRGFLQLALVGSVTVGLAGIFGLLGHRHGLVSALGLGGSGETPRPGATGSTGAAGGAIGGSVGGGEGPSPSPSARATAGPSTAAPSAGGTKTGGKVIAQVGQVRTGRAFAFRDPATGDPAYLLKLPDGSVVAYDAVCTHAGCTVRLRPGLRVLLVCPCHGAAFDPGHHAQPVAGPTDVPLARLPIRIDSATGTITLSG